eukprot:Gb_18337 [translate_table: standard]
MADFSNKVGLWSVEKVSEGQVNCFWEAIAKIQRTCGPFAAMERTLVATIRCLTWLGWCDVRWVEAAREVKRHCREMYDQLLQMNNTLHLRHRPQPYCVMITQPNPMHGKALPKVIPYILVDAPAIATEPLMTIKPHLPHRYASTSASALVFRQRSRSPAPPTSTSIARPPPPTSSSSSKHCPARARESSRHHPPPTSSSPHPRPNSHPRTHATVPRCNHRPPVNSSSPLPRPPGALVKPQNTKPIHRICNNTCKALVELLRSHGLNELTFLASPFPSTTAKSFRLHGTEQSNFGTLSASVNIPSRPTPMDILIGGYVNTVEVLPDGSLCASGGKDGVTMLWDSAEGKRLYSLDAGDCMRLLPSIFISQDIKFGLLASDYGRSSVVSIQCVYA